MKMSLIIKNVKPRQLLQVYKALSVASARQSSHFFPDYKPGAVPKTEEERIRAAKKYNLLPEEYECYPEGEGHGDYPKLPFESVDSRDPWYPWDNQELRKNFNEPVNVRMVNGLPEMMSTVEPRTPYWKGLLYFLSLCTGSGLIIYFLSLFKVMHPIGEKQYVIPGVTHYTFDLMEEVDDDIDPLTGKKRCVC